VVGAVARGEPLGLGQIVALACTVLGVALATQA